MVQLSPGRGHPAPAKPRAIVASKDGVFLWPGISLVQRKGEDFQSLDSIEIAELIKLFFGPQVHAGPAQTALRKAAAHLLRGDLEGAQHAVDRVGLPPVSPNGCLLMRAIARRQGISIPAIPVADRQSGTAWDRDFADKLAKTYDKTAQQVRALRKAFGSKAACECDAHIASQASKGCGCAPMAQVEKFNPTQPRIPKGNPGGGQWTADGDGDATVVPVQEVIITPRFIFPELVRPTWPEMARPVPGPRPMPLPKDGPLQFEPPQNPPLDVPDDPPDEPPLEHPPPR